MLPFFNNTSFICLAKGKFLITQNGEVKIVWKNMLPLKVQYR
jgi:hypothetical protein